MKKSICLGLVTLSLFALFLRFGLGPLLDGLGFKAKSGIRVTSIPETMVFLDGVEVGQTPYQNENLKSGEYKVELKAGEKVGVWQGMVKLNSGTISVANREVSPSVASSSGEVLILNKGKGVVITSSPAEAEVEIDGKFYGKTPLQVAELPSGEHTFLLSHSGYLKRSIRATVPSGMSLSLIVDLALSEADLSKVASEDVGVYGSTPLRKVTIKQTPTGFLRVRDKPSTLGREIAKVSPGEELVLLEELPSWMRVKLKDGTEGYISSTYAQKQP